MTSNPQGGQGNGGGEGEGIGGGREDEDDTSGLLGSRLNLREVNMLHKVRAK